jgi:ABC-2 type transport system permease protein
MSAVAEAEIGAPQARPAVDHPTRPFLWSVRREVWENGSLFIAPASAAVLVLVAFLIGASAAFRHYGASAILDPAHAVVVLTAPYEIGAMVIMAVSGLTAIFYCLGALHNERRDRSILFWKSMPVSDLGTVLSKAVVPMIVVPAITFAVIVAMQAIMLVLGTLVFAVHGLSPTRLWSQLNLIPWELALFWLLIASALWYAPLYGWLLLVSGWARRVTFLWAILPPIGLVVFERLAFGSDGLGRLFGRRLTGALSAAFTNSPSGEYMAGAPPRIDIVGFLTRPDVWGGLIVAVIFGAACVWLRRYREPI